MTDKLVSCLKCTSCGEVVFLGFESGYEDDRRGAWEHKDSGCENLQPVEIGRRGLAELVRRRS